MIVAQSRTKFPLPSSRVDLSTPIKPIVAILTGLVTPEPGDFHAPVVRLYSGCDGWNTEPAAKLLRDFNVEQVRQRISVYQFA
jgi:hypothetical protein